MKTAEVFAPAKINLTLHVTGQRQDGYHLLDSLVVFADIGDRILVRTAENLRLCVTGPMAAGIPAGPENLVLRAARLVGVQGVEITLEKHLPQAAGIGGGSADAAATLRALGTSHGAGMPAIEPLLQLGADVPACVLSENLRMRGIGERIVPVAGLPALPAVLINPGVPVQTPDVFRALATRDGAAMSQVPGFADVADCARWLAQQRNDLETPARHLCPPVGDCLVALQRQGAILARMSGSGATCFGLFETMAEAESAAAAMQQAQAHWWVRAVTLGAQP